MRLARLKYDLAICVDTTQHVTTKGTIVQVHDNPPSHHLHRCNIPGYSRVRYVATYYLEFLGETVEGQPEET